MVNADSLAALYQEHALATVRLVGILLGDRDQAQEVVQEAFVRLHEALPRLRDDAAAGAYLRSIALNLARSRLRRTATARRHLAELVPTAPLGPAPDEAAVAGDDRRAVLGALRRLPERQRECLVLRHYAGLTDAGIAEALSISPSSVKTHLQRGLVALAADLEDRR